MGSFDQSKAYAAQEEEGSFFDDGREIELLHFIYSHPNIEKIRGSPENVLAAIDEYGRTKKYLMNVGEDKGRIVTDLIAEVKPKTMVELGGYVGYSCILFANAVRKAGGERYFSFERDPAFAAVIMSLVDLAGLTDLVKVIVGSSDEGIARLVGSGQLKHVDLMFLDHYKPAYTTDLKLCEELGLITKGSVLAADNVIKPGNPPYLKYVRASVEEKVKDAGKGGETNLSGIAETNVKMYEKKYGKAKFSESKGNPNLKYESTLVNSYEPTGVPRPYELFKNADRVPLYLIVDMALKPLRLGHELRSNTNSNGSEMAESQQNAVVPFYYNHVWKNALLLALSALCAPISAALVLVAYAVSKLDGKRNATFSEEDKRHVAAAQRQKTVLVTGVSMTKGLTIARNLSQHTPHRIIGADISALSPGRFSTAISKYYRLDTPSGDDAEPYIDSILAVMRRENVDLWISCSSVVAAVEDGQVVRLAEQQAKEQGRRFEAIQFREDVVEKFHEKDRFIDYIESLDLPIPESHRCTSPYEALDVLMGELHRTPTKSGRTVARRHFIMKPIGVDDKARNNMMTLLPFRTPDATTRYIQSLNISKENPFQLQQFIKGKEYCTHALVIRGKVKAFISCPSLELLMHYEPLPATSPLSQKMLEFTERVCQDGGENFTGHLSFDFLVEDDGKGGNAKFYPIESNPRAHTAVVLFEQTPEMAEAYMSIFNSPNSLPSKSKSGPVYPCTPTYSYYWIGHDLVSLVILPLLDLLFDVTTLQHAFRELETFWNHLAYWKDGTYTFEDPIPFFLLYHVYWPAKFLNALVTGKGWSRINVSTTKMFE
ncbi:catechol O-methyltransferase [Pyrenophora seminiperda CCB06]|uniref:catechol O-methyltransferase n=1 Tax=Pyrenophora seminiperda CCB06 TaxID=1302712 RepID=A0A3M7MHJ8_9PLEO|nr:catechol O-methyltransferase [Pyrenophora seminiperda CCB06]